MTYTFGLDTFGDRNSDADGKPPSVAFGSKISGQLVSAVATLPFWSSRYWLSL